MFEMTKYFGKIWNSFSFSDKNVYSYGEKKSCLDWYFWKRNNGEVLCPCFCGNFWAIWRNQRCSFITSKWLFIEAIRRKSCKKIVNCCNAQNKREMLHYSLVEDMAQLVPSTSVRMFSANKFFHAHTLFECEGNVASNSNTFLLYLTCISTAAAAEDSYLHSEIRVNWDK